eukprot:scaffold182276_cov24-Tisochrysis_lutea.AAC.2
MPADELAGGQLLQPFLEEIAPMRHHEPLACGVVPVGPRLLVQVPVAPWHEAGDHLDIDVGAGLVDAQYGRIVRDILLEELLDPLPCDGALRTRQRNVDLPSSNAYHECLVDLSLVELNPSLARDPARGDVGQKCHLAAREARRLGRADLDLVPTSCVWPQHTCDHNVSLLELIGRDGRRLEEGGRCKKSCTRLYGYAAHAPHQRRAHARRERRGDEERRDSGREHLAAGL